MNVSDVEAELQRALQLQSSTAAALKEAVQDKLKAEADLKKVMVSTTIISVKGMFWGIASCAFSTFTHCSRWGAPKQLLGMFARVARRSRFAKHM
jgi:hypothetical protein